MLINSYSDVSISRSGGRKVPLCDRNWGAHCNLDADVRELFPYINADKEDARYQHRPLHVQFHHEKVLCTLYPEEAIAAPFKGRDHVFDFLEGLITYLNNLHKRCHELKPDHNIYRQPPSVVDILKALPRTNCRACGHATCSSFAVALRSGQASPSHCPDFVQPISVSTVYPVIGQDGTIESTFSIENDIGASQSPVAANPDQQELERHKSPKEEPTIQPPRYDRHGIRIQYDLTGRETQVLRLMADGATNPQISEMLHISPHTVKSHVIHIFNKLNVNDRTQAAVWATRNKIV